MRQLLRSLHHRLKVRGWVALGLLVAAAALVPLLAGSCFVAQRRAAFALKRAQADRLSHNFDRARTEFHAALILNPDDSVARRELADMELSLGNSELAFLDYESLTEMHPEEAEGWVRLADLMVQSGQLEAPEAVLDRAIGVDPHRIDARRQRGEIRFRLGRYYGALQDARAAVAAAPSDPTSWVLLVHSVARAQGTDVGIETAKRALAKVGEQPALLSALASLLAQSGRMPEARALLQKELSDSPSGSERARSARLALARLELGAANAGEARRLLDGLLAEHPSDVDGLVLRAVLDAQDGQLDGALGALDAGLVKYPDADALREVRDRLQLARNHPDALAALVADTAAENLGPAPALPRRFRRDAQTGRGNLGAWTREHWPGRLAVVRQALETELERRDWTAAQQVVDAASSAYPSSLFAPYLEGILELARGNLDQAERKLSEALAISPRQPEVLAALGRTWSMKRGPSFAAPQLMRLAARDPGLSLARYMAARAYIEAGDPPRAEAALTRGLQLQPNSPIPYQHLTDYYFGLDRTAEALEICRQGLERFPENTDLQMMLAQIYTGAGQAQEAIRVYEALVSRRPDLDIAQYKLAVLLAGEAGEESKRKFLAAVGQLKGDVPSDPLLLDALGWMLFHAQDGRRARLLLEAAVRGAPEEPSVHYHLAMVYAQQNEVSLERQELKTALESPRPFPEKLEALRLFRLNENAPPSKTKVSAAGGH